jgi:hypothetical protein
MVLIFILDGIIILCRLSYSIVSRASIEQVTDKSNEITAIPNIINSFLQALQSHTLGIDTMRFPYYTCSAIHVKNKGNYDKVKRSEAETDKTRT